MNSNISNKKSLFNVEKIKFYNFIGDITKEINWTWIIYDLGINLFNKFLNEINLLDTLNTIFNNKFKIYGISFITINNIEIKESETNFHYDILSPYDLPNQTNILTVIIPLIFDINMYGIQYKDKFSEIIDYKYQIGEYFVFDSSKVEHRTLPFLKTEKKSRVLISINLSSDLEWAILSTQKCTLAQGNILNNN